jgi:hypothetical protein
MFKTAAQFNIPLKINDEQLQWLRAAHLALVSAGGVTARIDVSEYPILQTTPQFDFKAWATVIFSGDWTYETGDVQLIGDATQTSVVQMTTVDGCDPNYAATLLNGLMRKFDIAGVMGFKWSSKTDSFLGVTYDGGVAAINKIHYATDSMANLLTQLSSASGLSELKTLTGDLDSLDVGVWARFQLPKPSGVAQRFERPDWLLPTISQPYSDKFSFELVEPVAVGLIVEIVQAHLQKFTISDRVCFSYVEVRPAGALLDHYATGVASVSSTTATFITAERLMRWLMADLDR